MTKGKKMELEGSITSSIREDKIILQIQDKSSSITFLEITLNGNDFLRMLNGLAYVKSDLVLRGIEKVGMVYEHKHFVFEYPKDWTSWKTDNFTEKLHNLGTKLINKQQPNEGWILDKYFGSKKSTFQKDGKNFAQTVARRWVKPASSTKQLLK